jgi:hypothetical protein
MDWFNGKEEDEQKKAEELGFADITERRVEDIGKPKPPEPKADSLCVIEGCQNGKAPGQNFVCVDHIRTN